MSIQREWQEQQRARGNCVICGTKVTAVNPKTGYEYTLCDEHRAKSRARMAARYARGKCAKCQASPPAGRKYCEACLERKAAQRALRSLNGICLVCPNPVVGTSSRCNACLEKMRAYALRRYRSRRLRVRELSSVVGAA